MKVTILLFAKFHAFHLAQQLYKRGHLRRLITSYPKFKIKEFGIPDDKIKTFPYFQFYNRLIYPRLPAYIQRKWSPWHVTYAVFPEIAAKSIPEDTDIVVSWTGFARQAFQRAQEIGAVKILDRGSSHPVYCKDMVKQEHHEFDLIGSPLRREEKIDMEEYELADYVSIPSKFVKRTFLENNFSEEKLIHVPFGADLKNFYPSPKRDNVFRVIFAGGMSLRKGVHYLLRAFSELNLPNSEMLLIGGKTKEIEPYFKKYSGSFKYVKPVPQKELVNYYAQGSVFAICSIEEGLAMVQIEAMACGLPVICTTNTGGDDIVRNGKDGFVIPIRNVDALKEKIQWFYDNPEACKAMGESARKRVEAGFSWDDYGRRIIDEFKKTLYRR